MRKVTVIDRFCQLLSLVGTVLIIMKFGWYLRDWHGVAWVNALISIGGFSDVVRYFLKDERNWTPGVRFPSWLQAFNAWTGLAMILIVCFFG